MSKPLFLLLVGLVVCVVPAVAEKPGDKQKASLPTDGLEGLGFSVAPRDGGKAQTSLFGVAAEGYKFVYVFDRSGSMSGRGREALQAVKGELLRSLKPLDEVHQFQIVFYNEQPILFNPSGTPGRLAFATVENKRRVERFLEGLSADGGTEHENALRMAIRLHPDVIFFLTDADDPKLSATQLERIQRMAAGTIIHAIEFGPGPKPQGQTFVEDLARQNGGKYRYIDIGSLSGQKRAKVSPES